MENPVQTVNVQEIMNEIRRDIQIKGYKNSDLSFPDIPYNAYSDKSHIDSFAENIRDLRNRENVFASRPIKSNRVFGFAIVAFKKIIRRLMSFYIEPIVSDQNVINRLSVSRFIELYLEVESLRSRVEYLEKRNERQGP